MDYRSAGVDVEAGYKTVSLIKNAVERTFRKEVLGGLGGFGAAFSIAQAKNMEEPVLISGTDGVGTKLKIAFIMDKHNTIGIDCVAMCVNDIICNGAEPLFFLDYLACGKNVPEKMAEVIHGVVAGCEQGGLSLVGGETAEMPGFYPENEYDLAGFAVGIVDKPKMITGQTIQKGDVIIGLASSGLHSNGFSLVRKLLRPNEMNLHEYVQALGKTLGEELLTPTRIYVKTILALKEQVTIKGLCNITGGGFYENVPRMLPEGSGLCAKIYENTWEKPHIFPYIQQAGALTSEVMFGTFNMGIGMMLTVAPEEADKAVDILKNLHETPSRIGEITEGKGIDLCFK